ncbi:TetR/AcrR family transcriptional regulator C-terminal domain-containing protein [Burkholderia territorii]|uniref:TetR/AcrR family transcriptional regulator C-terminal domain-containing protein n=1 Tax=Burkholderia territorii TaxID=1503055 RepID=UPI0007B7D4CE|nr:TetR/AcrR family transcriptional regulator C-terminal domain-containing protein [Burkholderia territorii]
MVIRTQRQQVIEVALALLDEVGIEGLSMRRLADGLKIQAPSLYWHFANKQELIDELADALIAPVAKALDTSGEWDDVVRRIFIALRRALCAHRDGGRVFAGTYVVAGNTQHIANAVIGVLRSAGMSTRVAAWGTFSLLYHVLGFVIEEQAFGVNGASVATDLECKRRQLAALPHRYFPHVLAALGDILDEDQEARFAFGLNLQIEGLRAKLTADS